MSVFVLDQTGKPIMPCSEKRARKLIQAKRAKVHKMIPFTIRLIDVKQADVQLQSLYFKTDPGSKTTGIALSIDNQKTKFLIELEQRGQLIRNNLEARASLRRGRRSRKLRYRKPVGKDITNKKFNRANQVGKIGRRNGANNKNIFNQEGWLAPSIRHRIEAPINWLTKLSKLAPITHVVQELVRFDTQKMENPEISGEEYQQGSLAEFETKEYLLEKWGRCCAYCGAKNVPLEIEHIVPKRHGGSNRVSNLTLACRPCNEDKSAQDLEAWLLKTKRVKGTKETRQKIVEKVLKHAKAPLKDASAVNSTRWAFLREVMLIQIAKLNLPYTEEEVDIVLKNWQIKRELIPTKRNMKGVWFKKFENYEQINAILKELQIEVGTGGQTKMNRHHFKVPKTHALDALCVGDMKISPSKWQKQKTLLVKVEGRGKYQLDNDSRGTAKRQVRADAKIAQMPEHKRPKGWKPMAKMAVMNKSADKKSSYKVYQAPSKTILKANTKQRSAFGFQSGDVVFYDNKVGKVIIRASGSFGFVTGKEKIDGINHKKFKLIQRKDGYSYFLLNRDKDQVR